MAYYFDSSALAKLLFPESESGALKTWLNTLDGKPSTSRISTVELNRLTIRADSSRLLESRDLLAACDLIEISHAVLQRAGTVEPSMLRTLDAIHLASAMALGTLLDGIVTYDIRLADACTKNGIRVIAPS